MKYKKTLLTICIIVCVLFSISSSMASDTNETEIAIEDDNQVIEETNDELISASVEEVLATDNGTFTALQNNINSASPAAKEDLSENNDILELSDDSKMLTGENASIEVKLYQSYDHYKMYCYVPSDATGDIFITFNSQNYSSHLSGQTYVIFDLPDMDARTYDLIINYTGNSKYSQKTIITTMDVEPCIFYALNNDLNYNENYLVSLKTYKNTTGTLYVTNGGNKVYASAPVFNGSANISLNLDLGEYYFNLKYIDNNDSAYNLEAHPPFVRYQPKINLPGTYLWIGEDHNISIEMPEKYNGNLTLTDNDKINETVRVTNGCGNMKIPALESGNYQCTLRYVGDNDYRYTIGYYFTIRAENQVFQFNASVPERVFFTSNVRAGNIIFPDGKRGKLEMIVDGEVLNTYNIYSSTTNTEFTISTGQLSQGQHELTIRYSDDVYYKDTNQTFTINVVPLVVSIPKEVILGSTGYSDMIIQATRQLNGSVLVYIDDSLKINRTLGSFSRLTFVLDDYDLKYGEHSYTVICPQNTSLNSNGVFNVDYCLGAYYSSLLTYGEDAEIDIYSYRGLEGEVVVAADGKTYNVKTGYETLTLSGLKYGDNLITVTYNGDEKYPYKSINLTLSVAGKIKSPDYSDVMYKSDNDNITLLLPSDAKGNLTVYERNYNSITGNYDFYVIKSAKLKEGSASLNIYDLPLGEHDIVIRYDGDDYSVEEFSTGIKIVPKLTYPTGLWSQVIKDYIMTVEIPESATGNVILAIYEQYGSNIVEEIYSGLIIGMKTFKFPELEKGNYRISVSYPDKSISNQYQISVRDTNPDWKINATFSYVINEDGDDASCSIKNRPNDLRGKFTFYLDGVKITQVDYWDYYDLTDLSLGILKDGTHTWKLEYSDDGFYHDTSVGGTFKVGSEENPNPNPNSTSENSAGHNSTNSNVVDAKITASDLNTVYTSASAFKVTVYGTDGKLASGVSVVIKVNGKTAATVKTTNGIAVYKTAQTPGTYKISATALGKTITKTLTVKHLVTLKSVTVKKSAKKLVIQASLAKVNGKYLKNKKITFKFNGKKYTAKTNAKGVAKLTIKSSVLKKLKVGKKVTYQATYLKDTVKKTVKIKK